MKMIKLTLFGISLSLISCLSETRNDAEENTSYAKGIIQNGLDNLDKISVGMPINKAIDLCGEPLWIRKLPDFEVIDKDSETENIDLDRGKFRLYYSQQKNTALDFIRITILSENGKIVEIENEWYRE